MRARIGQHFLKDGGVARRIVGALPIGEGKIIIEIGPGRGALTALLAERVGRVPGAELVCIERDPILAEALRARAWHTIPPRVITGDARTALPEPVRELTPDNTYIVVGNLPYYLTGRLFRILGELSRLPEAAVFMVQREVAMRLTAAPPHMNLLAASVQAWARVSLLFHVPASAFTPQPRVESAVVLITATRTTPPPAGYYQTARVLFKQPRKTLLNNLAVEIGREDATWILAEVGLDPSGRPQSLSPEAIFLISKHPPFSDGGFVS